MRELLKKQTKGNVALGEAKGEETPSGEAKVKIAPSEAEAQISPSEAKATKTPSVATKKSTEPEMRRRKVEKSKKIKPLLPRPAIGGGGKLDSEAHAAFMALEAYTPPRPPRRAAAQANKKVCAPRRKVSQEGSSTARVAVERRGATVVKAEEAVAEGEVSKKRKAAVPVEMDLQYVLGDLKRLDAAGALLTLQAGVGMPKGEFE